MSATWNQWLTGLLNAAISGFASGLAAGTVGASLKQALAVGGTSASVSLVKWVLQHPLPGAEPEAK